MVGLRQLRFLECQRNSYPETNSAGFILLAENKARFWLETTTIHLRQQLSPSPAFLPSKGDLLRAGLSEPFAAGECTRREALHIPMAPINRTDTYKYNSKGRMHKDSPFTWRLQSV